MIIENKVIRTKDNRLVLAHRYIMEQYLGRQLTSSEVVHHINGNHNDNRLENLQIMTRSEHSQYHGKYTKKCKYRVINTNAKITKNISLEENIIKLAKVRAKSLGFTFSAYITYLVNND